MKIFLVVEIRLSSGLNKSFHPSVYGLHCGRGTATELVSVLQAEMNAIAINDLLLLANAVVDSICYQALAANRCYDVYLQLKFP